MWDTKKYSNCAKWVCIKHKAKEENGQGYKLQAHVYSIVSYLPGLFRVSKVELVTGSLLWTERTLFSRAKQITAASILPCSCYRFNPLNKWLNNLLTGWLTDTQLPCGSWICFVFSGLEHHSTSTAPAFSLHRSFSLFPPLCHSPVLSFHFGINPFHPSGSFCSSLTTFFLN